MAINKRLGYSSVLKIDEYKQKSVKKLAISTDQAYLRSRFSLNVGNFNGLIATVFEL